MIRSQPGRQRGGAHIRGPSATARTRAPAGCATVEPAAGDRAVAAYLDVQRLARGDFDFPGDLGTGSAGTTAKPSAAADRKDIDAVHAGGHREGLLFGGGGEGFGDRSGTRRRDESEERDSEERGTGRE